VPGLESGLTEKRRVMEGEKDRGKWGRIKQSPLDLPSTTSPVKNLRRKSRPGNKPEKEKEEAPTPSTAKG